MSDWKTRLATKATAGVLTLVLFLLFILLTFFLFNGITAGVIWLIATYGLIPMFPNLEQHMLSFWQIFWIVALIRAIKSVFFTSSTKE